jgi:hypothetical protein
MLLLCACGKCAKPTIVQRNGAEGRPKGGPFLSRDGKKANLRGTVKVMASVAPDGSVKAVDALGGSPLLVQAAQNAIIRWRFAPANAESKELIELHFHPE